MTTLLAGARKIKRLVESLTGLDDRRLMRDMRTLTPEDGARARFYRQFIAPGDVVFDVGANFGNRTKVFLELGARVVAFEPQPNCADALERAYSRNADFTLSRNALGASAGEAPMFISDAHTVSTLSSDWVRNTTETGRFEGVTWNKTATVSLTTLDAAIEEYGRPAFMKIDVEGFEYEVLKGLSSPVDALSIEFATETLPTTFLAMDHMCGLAATVFQMVQGEADGFAADRWMTADAAKRALGDLCTRDTLAWGDVYMKRAT